MPTNAAGTGFWTAQSRNNALQGRTLLQGLYLATNVGGANPVPLSANRTGVVCTSDYGADIFDLRVTVTSGLTMSVKPGTAIVHRDGVGPYEGWLRPGAVSVTCDAAPVSNPRNDIVVLRIYDAAQGDTVPGTGPVQIEVITGTPGAVPVDPVNVVGTISSWPVSGGGVGIALARARVSTSGVITLTDVRRSTGVLGAVRPLLPGDLLADGSNLGGDLRWTGSSLDAWQAVGGFWQPMGMRAPSCTARITTTLPVAASTDSDVLWQDAPVNSTAPSGGSPMWSAAVDGYGIYIREAGVYEGSFQMIYAANATGSRRVASMTLNWATGPGTPSTNAATKAFDSCTAEPTGAGARVLKGTTQHVQCAVGDIWRISTWHDASTSLNILGNTIEGQSFMTLKRIR